MQTTAENTDRSLLDEIGADLSGWTTHTFDAPEATVSNQAWQVVFNAEAGRAGLVFIGSGSSGHTLWTDANSADDAYQQMLEDRLSP